MDAAVGERRIGHADRYGRLQEVECFNLSEDLYRWDGEWLRRLS